MASFKYPAILLNVVAFPVFIFPPPGPFAQQTGFFFPFGCACLERVSQEAQHQQSLKPQGWSWGYLGDQEEMCVLGVASSSARAGGRNRNFNFFNSSSMRPTASPLPTGAGQQWGEPLWDTLSQGCFVLWDLSVAGSWGEMTSRNPRQLAWKIPGSLIYSQNMFA